MPSEVGPNPPCFKASIFQILITANAADDTYWAKEGLAHPAHTAS